jgi:preprotein translocase subunit SecE
MSKVGNYVIESFEELKTNVSWLKWEELQRYTIIVALFSIFFSLTIWGIDEILSNALSVFLGWLKS